MKAVIPAAGRGSRMGALSLERPKALIEVCGRPLICHALDGAVEFGVDEIVVVTAPEQTRFRTELGTAWRGVPLHYVCQLERNGLISALLAAAGLVEGADIALLLADEVLIRPRRAAMRTVFDRSAAEAVIGVMGPARAERIQKNYDVERDGAGRVVKVVEKPVAPVGGVIGLGNCLFRSDVIARARALRPHPVRGEKELAGLIQDIVDGEGNVLSHHACLNYVNVNGPSDLATARILLEEATASPVAVPDLAPADGRNPLRTPVRKSATGAAG